MISQVIAHPTEEQFAILERVQATTADAPSTRILVFHASSSMPVAIRTLPFGLRSTVPVPSTGFFPTDSSSFTLVGITEAWSVVVFGDDVQLPEEEGASAQGITQDAAVRKRSLFHDIFGASAFADLTSAPGPSAAPAHAHTWNAKEAVEILDTPAHLLPPVESLFDSVMDSFLAARPEGDEEEPEQQPEDEMDVDEPADEDDRPAKGGAPLDRVVDRQEMHGFVELFMHHAIKGMLLLLTLGSSVLLTARGSTSSFLKTATSTA